MKNYQTLPYDIDPSHIPYLKYDDPTPGKTHLVMAQPDGGYYFLPNTKALEVHKVEAPIGRYVPSEFHKKGDKWYRLNLKGLEWLNKDVDGSKEKKERVHDSPNHINTYKLVEDYIENPGSHGAFLHDTRFITDFINTRKYREYGSYSRNTQVKGVREIRWTGDGWARLVDGHPRNFYSGPVLYNTPAKDMTYGLGKIVDLIDDDCEEWLEELFVRLEKKYGSTLNHFDNWRSMLSIRYTPDKLEMGETAFFKISNGSLEMRLKEMTWTKELSPIDGLSELPDMEFHIPDHAFPKWICDYKLFITINKDDRKRTRTQIFDPETGKFPYKEGLTDMVRFSFIAKTPPHQLYCFKSVVGATIL